MATSELGLMTSIDGSRVGALVFISGFLAGGSETYWSGLVCSGSVGLISSVISGSALDPGLVSSILASSGALLKPS